MLPLKRNNLHNIIPKYLSQVTTIQIVIIIILQNDDEVIKNYTREAVVILKTEPDLVYLVEQLQCRRDP